MEKTNDGNSAIDLSPLPGKQTGAALSAFRRKMNFPPQATNADLFDALEKGAIKALKPRQTGMLK